MILLLENESPPSPAWFFSSFLEKYLRWKYFAFFVYFAFIFNYLSATKGTHTHTKRTHCLLTWTFVSPLFVSPHLLSWFLPDTFRSVENWISTSDLHHFFIKWSLWSSSPPNSLITRTVKGVPFVFRIALLIQKT